MLNVLTQDGVYIYLNSLGGGAIPGVLIGPADQILHGSGARKPGLNLDLFDQGPISDDAGNKSVFHRKVEGTVSAMPYGVVKKPYYCIATNTRQDAYYLRQWGSGFPTATILGPRGGAWSSNMDIYEMMNLGGIKPYQSWLDQHVLWRCAENVSVSVPAPGKIKLIFHQHFQWYPNKDSHVLYHEDRMQENLYEISCDRSGRYSYTMSGKGETRRYYGRQEQVQPLEGELALDYRRVHCNLQFPHLTQFGLGFNTTAWLATRADVDKAEREGQMWPNLCQEAVLSMNYLDCNSLALIKDLADLKGTVESTAKAFKDLSQIPGDDLKTALKRVGNADLSRRYGYGLTVQDAGEVGEALERLRQNMKTQLQHCQKIRSAGTLRVPASTALTVDVKYHYLARLALNVPVAQKLISKLYEWDLYPSLGNAWDFIPYSFVVDWFVDVGSMLEDIDANLQMRQYHLKSAVKSRKIGYCGEPDRILLHEVPLMGYVEVTEYRRWIDKQFDPMPISLHCDPSKVLGHLVEGAELLLQRL